MMDAVLVGAARQQRSNLSPFLGRILKRRNEDVLFVFAECVCWRLVRKHKSEVVRLSQSIQINQGIAKACLWKLLVWNDSLLEHVRLNLHGFPLEFLLLDASGFLRLLEHKLHFVLAAKFEYATALNWRTCRRRHGRISFGRRLDRLLPLQVLQRLLFTLQIAALILPLAVKTSKFLFGSVLCIILVLDVLHELRHDVCFAFYKSLDIVVVNV
jgi:hypothetical protein